MKRTPLTLAALLCGCTIFSDADIDAPRPDTSMSVNDAAGDTGMSHDGGHDGVDDAGDSADGGGAGDARATTDAADCTDACTLDTTRCFPRTDGVHFEVCETSPATGCTQWRSVTCETNQTCDEAMGCVCEHACMPNVGVCVSDEVIRRCIEDDNGCRILDDPEDCPGADDCIDGQCVD